MLSPVLGRMGIAIPEHLPTLQYFACLQPAHVFNILPTLPFPHAAQTSKEEVFIVTQSWCCSK